MLHSKQGITRDSIGIIIQCYPELRKEAREEETSVVRTMMALAIEGRCRFNSVFKLPVIPEVD